MAVYSSIRANIEGGECIICSEKKTKVTQRQVENIFDRLSQHDSPVEMALVFLIEEHQNGVEGEAFDSPASFDGAIF